MSDKDEQMSQPKNSIKLIVSRAKGGVVVTKRDGHARVNPNALSLPGTDCADPSQLNLSTDLSILVKQAWEKYGIDSQPDDWALITSVPCTNSNGGTEINHLFVLKRDVRALRADGEAGAGVIWADADFLWYLRGLDDTLFTPPLRSVMDAALAEDADAEVAKFFGNAT